MFPHLLLQAASGLINTNNLLNALMSQGPCVALLAIAVIYLNKRYTTQCADTQALNDKMEKYMTEDREKMLTVIENNTKIIQDFINTSRK